MTDQTEVKPEFEVSPDELSTNFYYTLGNDEQFNMQFTVRGNPTGAEIEAHFRAVVAAAKLVVEHGGHAKQVGAQSYTPKASKAVESINTEAQLTGLPLPATPAPVKTASVDTSTTFQIHAVKMQIEARPDGKSKVKFFANGHEYPDIDVVRTPDQLAQLMSKTADWKPEHFKTTVEAKCDYLIEYVNSEKLNSKGNPYKNITAVLPA